MNARAPLLTLAVGAFGIGSTEFAPMGMLPSMATELGVSLSTAGLLISAYAVGVVIGAPLILLFDRPPVPANLADHVDVRLHDRQCGSPHCLTAIPTSCSRAF